MQLGKIYWSVGRDRGRGREDRAALRAFPGYAYALDQLARVAGRAGRLPRGDRDRAAGRRPDPPAAVRLDARRPLPRHRPGGQARRQYALIGVIERLLVANGVKTDLETALFDVDHAIRLPHALALARVAHAERPSIDGDDVLAWALARNGRCGEALGYSKQALRLGTKDALKFFHRGMIERCLGHDAAAGPGSRARST